ncbi:hypothetical protein DUI87_34458 [Hirundo rustica rustica]|uniref:RNA-directed DNA polymerase n=1 Tax=Hirundo rustica rustica TaxID=333673 RepID=A0A3M0J3R2_HIRRU|nr:hypothetical protein DUI87_34458 [Hirundo rustica rustica]
MVETLWSAKVVMRGGGEFLWECGIQKWGHLGVAKNTQFSLRPKSRQEPVQGPTVFTDGSGKTGKAIVTWQDGSEWQVLEGHEDGSAQLVELKAAVVAFEKFSQEPFNLITDSAYVADIAQRLSCSVLKEVSNPALFDLLKALWCAIQARVHPYYVLHVRSHTNLPGFVAEGNARADKLANPAWVAPQPDVLAQAKASHGFFHQNAHMLQKQFQLTATEARELVESCDDCHALGAPLPAGVNPRGLKALELWQTDVTQVAEFGRLKYVHVTVDTFSSAMWASAHTGEKARDVIAHWRQAFAVLGIPSAVKTDSGPAYASQQASDGEQQPRAKVRVRNLVTKQWEGPYDLIAMGRGYACVSTVTLGNAGILMGFLWLDLTLIPVSRCGGGSRAEGVGNGGSAGGRRGREEEEEQQQEEQEEEQQEEQEEEQENHAVHTATTLSLQLPLAREHRPSNPNHSWVSILDQYPYFFNKSFWRARQETALSGRGASGVQDPSGRPPGIFWAEGSCGPADHPGKDQNLLELRIKGVEELLVHRMYRGLWAFV